MKYLRTTLLAVMAAILLPGCDMTEDIRNCPLLDNVRLTLVLKDKDGNEVFQTSTEVTDVFIYEASGRYHSRVTVRTADLSARNEVRLTLDPGSYRLVAWSNLNGRVGMCGDNELQRVETGYIYTKSAESGDPVYYALCDGAKGRGFNPGKNLYTLTVPPSGDVSETIEFTHAHKLVDVYVSGYSVNGKLPVVEVDGNRNGFDFYMNRLPDELTFRQSSTARTTADGEMAHAPFYSARFNNDNHITVHIVHPETGDRIYSKNLNEVMATYPNFDLEKERIIPVVFEFFDGRFEVKMPSWISNPSKPGVN